MQNVTLKSLNATSTKHGYEKHIKILVAFSGKVTDDNFPDGVTEPQLTGYGEKELPQKFAEDDYKILIAADKFQTGFDQPLLHTMYVDKPLSGVRAVQTLSRLNRTAPGKRGHFYSGFRKRSGRRFWTRFSLIMK